MDWIKLLENNFLYFRTLNMGVEKSKTEEGLFEVKYVLDEKELKEFMKQYEETDFEIIPKDSEGQ